MDEFCFVFSTILAIGLVVRDRDWERFMGRKVAKNLIVCLFVLDEAVYRAAVFGWKVANNPSSFINGLFVHV